METFKLFVILSILSRCSANNFESRHELCSHPLNWRNATCQGWLRDHGIIDRKDDNKNDKDGSSTEDMKYGNAGSSGIGRIVGGDNAPLGAYPWFAKAVRKFLGFGMWEGRISSLKGE